MGLSDTWYIGLTITGCIILCIIIVIVFCLWRKNRIEATNNVKFLKREQNLTKPAINEYDSDIDKDKQQNGDAQNFETNGNGSTNNDFEIVTDSGQNEPQQPIDCEEDDDNDDNDDNNDELKLKKSKSTNDSNHTPAITTIIHTDSKQINITNSTPSEEYDDNDDDDIEIITIDDLKHSKNETIQVPNKRQQQSMRIVLSPDDGKSIVLASQTPQTEDDTSHMHGYNDTTIILNESEEKEKEKKMQWKINKEHNNNKQAESQLMLDGMESTSNISSNMSSRHSTEVSWNPDANFDDPDLESPGNKMLGVVINENGHNPMSSMVINDDVSNDGYENQPVTPSEDEYDNLRIRHVGALPDETLPSHYLSDSVESLDPDFVLEPAYFENSEIYSMSNDDDNSMSRGPQDPIPPMQGNPEMNKSIPFRLENTETNITVMSQTSTILSDNSSVNSISSIGSNHSNHSNHIDNHSMAISNDLDFGSIEWSMPGMGIDQGIHQKSIQMMAQSINMINNIPNNNKINNNIKSIEMKGPNNMVNKSIQYDNNSIIGKSIDQSNKGIISSGGSIGGEGFVHWQMHGRKLMKMTHNELIKWLKTSKFDEETIEHFRKKKIDGKKLWQNIRNASMFLYNVGVVRPTLRDAIVQNIYLQLLPKTPGFDERHMSDFKGLQLIADGPISTVYRAIIKKEKLKLRESTVIIKGYHFTADEVRVGKIIQILVHMVTNITSQRFVKIHGFIRNMMEDDNDNNIYKRPMFGIVMEYCDGNSIQSIFNNGQNKHYHFDFNVMDKIGILIDVARAMQELHSKNTLHRNLKASNVLISNPDDIKLTDYCLDVTQLTDFTHSGQAKERSIRWMAPELIQTQNYTKQCDIYAFGITMYEICSGLKPYYQHTKGVDNLITKIIQNNYRPDIDDIANLPDALLELMAKCWNEKPEQRPIDFNSIIDELDIIKENIRDNYIRFDDFQYQQRVSAMYNYGKAFQSSPLLTMNNDNNDNHYNDYDPLGFQIEYDEYDDDNYDEHKFDSILKPYNAQNKPTHIKDDTALELDVLKKFEPRRRKIHKPTKKRPRKPLPKAPPQKALPQTDPRSVKLGDVTIHLPDKPLPPKPLNDNDYL